MSLSRRLTDGKNNPVPGASPERTPPAASSEGRIDALDAGRAVAIFGVILVHVSLWIPDLPHWLELVASMGQYGVQLFFVISAVTITLSLDDDAKRFGGEPVTIAQRFYIKRFFRIAPLYYVAILAYAIADYLARLVVHKQLVEPHSVSDVVANVVFVHGWVPGAINSVVPGGWSIGVEMFFYLFAPLLCLTSRTTRGMWLTTSVVLAASATAITIGACSGDGDTCAIENNSFLYFWPPMQLPCFVVGIWLAHYGKPLLRGRERLSPVATGITAAGGIAVSMMLYVAGVGMERAHWIAPMLAACASAALLVLLTQVPPWLRGAGVVSEFGKNSYGIYIWNVAAVALLRLALKSPLEAVDGARPVASFVAATVLACILSYLAARATAKHIERPCNRWARLNLLPGTHRAARPGPAHRRNGTTLD